MTARKPAALLVSLSITGFVLIFAGASSAIYLPETGQTKCYSFSTSPLGWNEVPCTGTGQDGEMKEGVAWPNPRFTTNEDTTITDHLTGLIWGPDGNIMPARDAGWDVDGTVNDGAVKWERALDYIKKLNAGNYLGHNDWRLPNLNELESLAHSGVANAAVWLNSEGFQNVQPSGYWTSTSSVRIPYAAWMISLHGGWVNESDKFEKYQMVWAVRNGSGGSPAGTWRTGQAKCYDYHGYEIPCAGTGQDGETGTGVAWPSPRFSDHGDGTVTDNFTGLMWTKKANTPGLSVCSPGTVKSWQQGLDHVKCLNTHSYLGYNDWRLPNRKEIRSLMDYGKSIPALPVGHPFTDVQADFWGGFYWSSTTAGWQASEAYLLYMQNGNLISGSKTTNNWIWPVRAGAPPDLVIHDFGAPITACGGQTIAITDMIGNIGPGSAGPSTARIYLSSDNRIDEEDLDLGSREVSSLAEGAMEEGTMSVTLPSGTSAGMYDLILRADADGVLSEADETNNDRSRNIGIGPDLVIRNLTMPTCVEPGISKYILVTVANRGACPARRSVVKFFASLDSTLDASDIDLGTTLPVPYLAPGAVVNLKIAATVPPRISLRRCHIIAYVDGEDFVLEFDETNNTKSQYVKIGGCP
jgi:hypothetical protein